MPTRRQLVEQFERQQTCVDCKEVRVLYGVTGWCKGCFDNHMEQARRTRRKWRRDS